MECSIEALQAFLDGELDTTGVGNIRQHLAWCPGCRQELSHLRLLWLELEQGEEIEVPVELPYLRQQAIARARAVNKTAAATNGISLWDAQKLAWQPVLAGVSQIPGTRQLGRLAKAAGKKLPDVIRGASPVANMISGKWRDRR